MKSTCMRLSLRALCITIFATNRNTSARSAQVHPSQATEFEWDDGNERELAMHRITATEVEQVFWMNHPLWARNKIGRSGDWLIDRHDTRWAAPDDCDTSQGECGNYSGNHGMGRDTRRTDRISPQQE